MNEEQNLNNSTKKAWNIADVRHSANQNWRKCGKCGKFISHEEMGKDAVCNFTPDTHFTSEKVEWIHNHCA
jgi:acetyl-CoA carboxylase beta subunit